VYSLPSLPASGRLFSSNEGGNTVYSLQTSAGEGSRLPIDHSLTSNVMSADSFDTMSNVSFVKAASVDARDVPETDLIVPSVPVNTANKP
jgi:hypothetical protein